VNIYTRSGDHGDTSYDGKTRVSKADAVIEALGTVDELNAALGVVRSHLDADIVLLAEAQQTLLRLGSELSVGIKAVTLADTDKLEAAIDVLDARLPELRNFIIPEGSPAVTFTHLARTVCRRLERRLVAVGQVDADSLRYVNRLADYLFVLGRGLGELG
jgi:cob(I)alamin adenosyltransferase